MAGLYLISPPKIDASFADKLSEALTVGVVKLFQLRLKNISDDEFLRHAEILMPICRANNVPFIVNDSAKIAKKCGADGVHLGSDDGDITAARKLLGENAIIGASCYNSSELATAAVNQGASQVSFGAFYPTKTKTPKAKAEIETLKSWKAQSKIPVCAIGGITPQNSAPLIAAGADYLCVISHVWDHPVSPAKAVQDFKF